MEIVVMLGFFCVGPFAILIFGYWLGRGAPGWPFALVRREAQPANGRNVYYEEQENYR